jgi:type I restriction enzyme S subunit
MRLLIPPQPIMAAFTEGATPIVRLVGHLRARSASLEAVRNLLLPKLVTGKIDVSELDLGAFAEVATV